MPKRVKNKAAKRGKSRKLKATARPTSEWTRPRSQKEAWDHVAAVFKEPPKGKRPSDPNRAAQAIIAEHMERTDQRPVHVVNSLAELAAINRAAVARGGKLETVTYLSDVLVEPGKVTVTDMKPITPAQLSAYMKQLGARGGKVSGAKRMENLSSSARRSIAQKAARARWAKRKKT